MSDFCVDPYGDDVDCTCICRSCGAGRPTTTKAELAP